MWPVRHHIKPGEFKACANSVWVSAVIPPEETSPDGSTFADPSAPPEAFAAVSTGAVFGPSAEGEAASDDGVSTPTDSVGAGAVAAVSRALEATVAAGDSPLAGLDVSPTVLPWGSETSPQATTISAINAKENNSKVYLFIIRAQ